MVHEGDPIGGSRLRIRESEAVADHHLGRSGLEHIPDRLALTPAAGRGNPWPPLLSLRGRKENRWEGLGRKSGQSSLRPERGSLSFRVLELRIAEGLSPEAQQQSLWGQSALRG